MINVHIDLDTGLLVSDAEAGNLLNTQLRSVTNTEFEVLIDACIPLNDKIKAAIARTYLDVDALYSLAIGNRAEEYKEAEAAALEYRATGYSGPVSEYIAAWAASNTPMTNTQSADAIIARAAGLRSAMLAIRSQRFVSQAAMRCATTRAELGAAVSAWGSFVAAIRMTLT